ncbi:MAG: ABC transporter substrate-binding protein [Acidimicrobiia bacterium]
MRRSVVFLVVVVLTALSVPVASAQDDQEAVLRIGLTQDWSTLNPSSGFAVPEYEVWNIHYAPFTTLAAADFSVVPAMAESWDVSEDGLVYTYTLREGLVWSDGVPITAEDIAWNVNTARDQGWDNMFSVVQNLDAVAIDDRTVEITTSVPDPKLPNLGVYILPKHIWEPIATDYDTMTQYDPGADVPGSGPFVVTEFTKGQSVVLEANPSYYGWEGGEPPYDKIVFQLFENPDAMVAALQQDQLDAIHGFPASSADALIADPDITVVAGQQGGFDEIAINGGAVEGQPHPALLDVNVRRAIAHGIDKQAMIEDLWFNLAQPLEVMSPSADPKWLADIPEGDRLTYDPAEANRILDEGGYADTDGDGIREMPDGTNPIIIRHAVNTDGDLAGSVGDLMVGWMAEIGIGVELEAYDQDALFGVIVDGTYDTFYWGWVPFVDPDPMLSYFTEAELGNYNDANWFDTQFDTLYTQQNQELDEAARVAQVHEMLTILHDSAVYIPLWLSPDLQAYRNDSFEGWIQQPADVGPVMFSNSSPSYVALRPVGAAGSGSDGTAPTASTAPGDTTGTTAAGSTGSTVAAGEGDADGGANWLLIGGIAVVVLGGGAYLVSRRKPDDERE